MTPASSLNPAADMQLQDLQRMAELGRLSASLLHELSNPLSAAMLHLELMEHKNPAVNQAKQSIRLMRTYIEAAKQQARRQSQTIGFLVNPQIHQLKQILNPVARKAGVRLDIGRAPSCRLYGDPVKFQQLLANLILNAIEAYGCDPIHEAMAVNTSFETKSRYLVVQVVDWGKGIQTPDLPLIFEPFFTTKACSRSSIGIGLSMVRQFVVNEFKGNISVSSTRRNGTRFVVNYPFYNSCKNAYSLAAACCYNWSHCF